MKKLSLLVFTAAILINFVKAQVPVKYQGEVDLGYSIGVGNLALSRVNLHTIQSAKIGNYFSAGVGVGLDYYHNIDKYMGALWEKGELVLPLYLNLTGYIPASKKVTLFALFDIGIGIGLTYGVSGHAGLYLDPAVGVKVSRFKVQLGYTMQKANELFNLIAGAVQLKVGIVF